MSGHVYVIRAPTYLYRFGIGLKANGTYRIEFGIFRKLFGFTKPKTRPVTCVILQVHTHGTEAPSTSKP